MTLTLKLGLSRQFNFALPSHFAKSSLTPTLSRLRARELELVHIGELEQNTAFSHLLATWLKLRNLANISSPAGGRGCPTGRERGAISIGLQISLLIAQRLNYAK